MKHLLNNLSEEEKNSIREQHEGGMKLDTSRFRTLLEGKLGNVKPLVEEEDEEFNEMVGVDYMSDDSEELDEDFESDEKPLNRLQKHFLRKLKSNPSIASDYGMSDEEFMDFIYNEIDDDVYNQFLFRYDDEDELDDLGYAQHDGSFDGDDSEEELDLTEFDDLEEDETW